MSATAQLIRRRPKSRWDSDVVAEGAGSTHAEAFDVVFKQAKFDDRIYVCETFEDRVVHTHYEVKNSSGGLNNNQAHRLTQSVVVFD